MNDIGLRPAAPADDEFCFELHRTALGAYVEAIWGWDEAHQRSLHQHSFDIAHTQIITVNGIDVGSLTIEYRPTEICLGRIEIHPDYQGRGVGRQLIQQLLDEAASRHRPVTLDVLNINHRAYALYERLGFHEVGRHGVDKVKIRMRAVPAPRSDNMQADVVIRPETLQDVGETARSHMAAWRAGYQGLVPAQVLDQMDLQQRIAKRTKALSEPDGSATLVAVRGPQVLGHVTVRAYPDDPSAGQVWSIYVDPQAWGTGVADQLLRQGLVLLQQSIVRLWVLETNARAVAFYARNGFAAEGERSAYEFAGTGIPSPLIRMTLDRTVHPDG